MLLHIDSDTEKCCGTCAHSAKRHGAMRAGMHPLVCLLYARAVPYVCGNGENGIRPYYPCKVVIDEGPVPMGWEARQDPLKESTRRD